MNIKKSNSNSNLKIFVTVLLSVVLYALHLLSY